MTLCPQFPFFLTDLRDNWAQKIFTACRSAIVSFKEIGTLSVGVNAILLILSTFYI